MSSDAADISRCFLSANKVILVTADASGSDTGADKCGDKSLRSSSVRLEKTSKWFPIDDALSRGSACHVITGSLFKRVVVNGPATDGLPTVRKPNIVMEFKAFVASTDCKDDVTDRWETRRLMFWFRKVDVEEQKHQATKYFKLLVEPETFPRDYAGYVKKAISLLWCFRRMSRVQLNTHVERKPEPEIVGDDEEEADEERIENFITVLTPAVYDYQYLPEVPVSKKSHVTFRVCAAADAHAALSMTYGDTKRTTYEVTLGSAGNSRSTVRYGARGPEVAAVDTPNLLAANDFKQFWISWNSMAIQVGRGSVPGKEMFMSWSIPMDKLHTINCMSVATGPGCDGQWEFIEYLPQTEEKSETNLAVKRAKLRRAVIWHAKKMKILQSLEEAFPSSLNTADLLRRSAINLVDSLPAVALLKDLESKHHVTELTRGIWLRAPVSSSGNDQSQNDFKIVEEFPVIPVRDQPTVAVFTTSFCEQVAFDVILEERKTFVRHNISSPINGESTQSYSLGRVGSSRVVSAKIPSLFSEDEAAVWHGTSLTDFIANFKRIKHVIIIGSGGAVPNFDDFERHVRLGDVAVSVPPSSGGPMYIQCQEISHEADGERSYATSVWDASADSVVDMTVRRLVDQHCGGIPDGSSSKEVRPVSRHNAQATKPWQRVIEEAYRRLEAELGESATKTYRRPPAKTDGVFAVIETGSVPVQVNHPVPRQGLEPNDGLTRIRCGVVASGQLVASNVTWRQELANGIVAYDRGLHHVIDALHSCSQLNGFVVVLGITDYVDGTRGRSWQPHSALCAVSFAKTLIANL